jgi:hypothetical protein
VSYLIPFIDQFLRDLFTSIQLFVEGVRHDVLLAEPHKYLYSTSVDTSHMLYLVPTFPHAFLVDANGVNPDRIWFLVLAQCSRLYFFKEIIQVLPYEEEASVDENSAGTGILAPSVGKASVGCGAYGVVPQGELKEAIGGASGQNSNQAEGDVCHL